MEIFLLTLHLPFHISFKRSKTVNKIVDWQRKGQNESCQVFHRIKDIIRCRRMGYGAKSPISKFGLGF